MDNMELMPVAAEPEVITHKSFEELDRDLQDELEREAEGFVKIGYMLKIFRDTTILQDTQYKDVYDYAMKRFHLDKSQVSRFTRINDKFSEGGYSEKLQDKYKGFGSSKLAIMLQFPDSITEEITPTFSKAEINEIKEELDEEKKTTDIEVMLEGEDERQKEQESSLQKAVWKLLHDDVELYEKVHGLAKRAKEENYIMEKAKIREEYHDILAPQGEALYSIRIQGIGRMMLSIKEEGKDIKVVNLRSGEKESYTWMELIRAAEGCVSVDMTFRESYQQQYLDEWPEEEEEEVAPVQTNTNTQTPIPEPVKKPEPRKQSKVSKAPIPKPKKEAPVAVEEKHEPLPGQTTVMDIPDAVPEEYKETVSGGEENKEIVSQEQEEDNDLSDVERERASEYKREYHLSIAEANNAMKNGNYDMAMTHLKDAIKMLEYLKDLEEEAADDE